CGEFYPCFRCHADAADHALSVWPRAEFDTHALLCGVCWSTLPISEYRATDACPYCGTGFNPGCSLHYPLYFAEEYRPKKSALNARYSSGPAAIAARTSSTSRTTKARLCIVSRV